MEILEGLTMAHVTLNPLSSQLAKGLAFALVCLPVVGSGIRTIGQQQHIDNHLHRRVHRYTLRLKH